MKFKWLWVWTLVFAVFGASALNAQNAEGACKLVSLFNAEARATAPGAPNGAVFGLLVNLGAEADTLISASTDVAEAVELHTSSMDDSGVMQMMPVEGGIEVAANNYVALERGGLHIMLINLKAPLQAGESFDLALSFQNAGEVTLSVPIREMMDAEMSMEMGMATPEMAMGDMHAAMDAASTDWGDCAGMRIVGAWARPSLPGAPNTGAYALLLNLTESDDTLVSAATTITQATELHEMIMGDGDVMQMRPIEGGIVVPAGGAALLKPGGLHVMLIGLNEELPAGSAVQITYTFAKAGVVTLDVPVHAPAEGGMAMGGS